MRKDKSAALELRKSEKSYREIKKLLKIPKSTLSDWLRKVKWSQKIRQILVEQAKEKSTIRILKLNKIRGRQLEKICENARLEAQKEFEHFKLYPLFIAGVSIYWGEGDKSSRHQVRISNIDPAMIKLFVKFLREICGVAKKDIYAYILLYPDLDAEQCKKFWIKHSNLLDENFNKSIVIKGRHKTRRLKHGVCYIGVSSVYLKEKINIWLKLLPRKLINEKYCAGIV